MSDEDIKKIKEAIEAIDACLIVMDRGSEEAYRLIDARDELYSVIGE